MPRLEGGKWSLMSETPGGCTPASPIPTPTRHRKSCQKLCESPHNPDMIENTPTQVDMIATRLRRSAMRAIGKPTHEYSSAKLSPESSPSCKSVSERSSLMACPST